MKLSAFDRGETVLVQEIWHERVWSARPMITISDSPERSVLWIPRGTTLLMPVTPPTRERLPTRGERMMRCLALEDWLLKEFTCDMSSLWFVEPGSRSCAWVSWQPDGAFVGWYINLQEPFQRTARGFRYMDLMLDILVAPDRTWRWKDEDEFEAMQRAGLLNAEGAQLVRQEAARMLGRLEENATPFCEPWSDWRPDPTWLTPVLRSDALVAHPPAT